MKQRCTLSQLGKGKSRELKRKFALECRVRKRQEHMREILITTPL